MKNIIIIAGPTAVGKTEVSIELALKLQGEIVSADSMQIYKHMNIGSAKPTPEEQSKVKHYLIDEIDPLTEFSVSDYATLSKSYIQKIFDAGKQPIISGGTGLYINSLLYDMNFSGAKEDKELREQLEKTAEIQGNLTLHNRLAQMDPKAAETIHPNNLKRVIRALEINISTGKNMASFKNDPVKTKEYSVNFVCLNRDRRELYDRINLRVDLMIQEGLIFEVEELMKKGLTRNHVSMQGIGYKEVIDYLEGHFSKEVMIDTIKQNSRHYAKRQLTWFKRYEDAHWINLSEQNKGKDDLLSEILKHIER